MQEGTTIGRLIITTSWDDGHPDDLRLAQLLMKYQIKATFYIPQKNSEGRPTMGEDDIRYISKYFEIGGHTIDHVRLVSIDSKEIIRQLSESKKWLEHVTGKSITGFCYPGGKLNPSVKEAVKKTGYAYARTIENFRMDFDYSSFKMPTTLQFNTHSKSVLIRNALRSKRFYKKILPALSLAGKSSIVDRFAHLINDIIPDNHGDTTTDTDTCLHIWGHSWEISQNNLWPQLEEVFKLLNGRKHNALFCTNQQCHNFMASMQQPQR